MDKLFLPSNPELLTGLQTQFLCSLLTHATFQPWILMNLDLIHPSALWITTQSSPSLLSQCHALRKWRMQPLWQHWVRKMSQIALKRDKAIWILRHQFLKKNPQNYFETNLLRKTGQKTILLPTNVVALVVCYDTNNALSDWLQYHCQLLWQHTV